MNSGRMDLLIPILDELAVNDQRLFHSIQQKNLGDATAHKRTIGSSIAVPISQAFTDKISERAKVIFREMQRVLAGAYIEDFDELSETLKREWVMRLDAMANVASSQFQSTDQLIRESYSFVEAVSGSFPQLPTGTTFSEHVDKLKAKWFAEIELFCINLHDSQAPRLFLKAGEVFAGNRAARAIFAGARQSLDIIDTYFGPEVFDMLEVTQQPVKIQLISDKAKNPTKHAYNLFNRQFNNRAEFRLSDPKDIHDRFIIVDGEKALHVGHSIKDWGGSDSLIDSAELDPHKKRFEELWLKAQPVV